MYLTNSNVLNIGNQFNHLGFKGGIVMYYLAIWSYHREPKPTERDWCRNLSQLIVLKNVCHTNRQKFKYRVWKYIVENKNYARYGKIKVDLDEGEVNIWLIYKNGHREHMGCIGYVVEMN